MAKKGGKLRTVYGIFFALLTLFVGGLFIRQVWSIYRSSPTSPYTVENISKHFQEISIPVWVWIGGLAVSILLALLLPEKAPRVKGTVDGKKTLEKVKARVPAEGEYYEKACALSRRQKGFRVFVTVFASIFMLAAAALCVLALLDIFYRPLVNKPFFTKQNGAVDKIVQTAILSIAALAIAAISAGLLSLSRKKEQKGYLAIIADSKKTPAPTMRAETPTAERSPLPVVEKKTSPWAAVIRKIVGKLFLKEEIPQEEIDRDIEAVLQGLEEGKLPPQPMQEAAAPVQEKEVKKEKKEKKINPLIKEKTKKKPCKQGKAGVIFLRVALAAAGVTLVVWGIFNGGMKDVLLKAINICTQCIGLG